MKINMVVKQGPKRQDAYAFPREGETETEATNIVVGRGDVSSEAHWRLSPQDQYVSRAHFVLEVRPPNCHLQDNMSMNGTFLRRSGEPERRAVNEVLQDGDQIRVGETVLEFRIEAEQPVKTKFIDDPVGTKRYDINPVQPQPQTGDGLMCVRCGEMLDALPSIIGSLRDLDFMCPRCRREVEAQHKHEAEKHAGEAIACALCGRDVSRTSNQDGRAAELRGVASYYCESCLAGQLEKNADRRRTLPAGEYAGHTLIKSLGKGGMGEVFLACETKTGRVAAIKQMLPIAKSDESSLRRFLREISIMQTLAHPNLVRLYASGQEGGSPFLVSEFVAGGDMSRYISDDGRPTMPVDQVVHTIAEALSGLAFFHLGQDGGKVLRVHRDLKPENILLAPQNGTHVPKLADFGLSKSYADHGGTETKTGEFAGTWMYMPPEQITNFKRSTPCVDIYAMGVTLYYLLSGRSPLPDFPAPWEILQKEGRIRLCKPLAQMVLHDPRVPLAERRSDLPRELCRVIDRSISMDAADRYQTAESFREALLDAL